MNISVVIPLLNEEESLQELYDWIAKVMQSNRYSYEIIFIDDGSTDTLGMLLKNYLQEHPQCKRNSISKKLRKISSFRCWF